MFDMEVKELLKIKLVDALEKIGVSLTTNDIVVEDSKDKTHGDYASNVALKYARNFGKNPKEVASLIENELDKEGIDHIEIAGPGFINFYMKNLIQLVIFMLAMLEVQRLEMPLVVS